MLEHYIKILRDRTTESYEFMDTLTRVGIIMASKMESDVSNPILIPVLRAGLPLYQGFHNVFMDSQVGFIGAMRDEETLEAEVSYVAIPELKGRDVIVIDTMLGTGNSLEQVLNVVDKEHPKNIFTASVFAVPQGYEKISKRANVYVAQMDEYLDETGYIVPGCGDAGDRCFGIKK